MEKNVCVLIVILVVVGTVIAEDDDNPTCCPPSTFILYDNDTVTCYDSQKNNTVPMKMVCVRYYITSTNFSVQSGNIVYEITDLYTVTYGSDMACYGNVTKSRNLTKVRSSSLICIDKVEQMYNRAKIVDCCGIVSVVFLGLTAIIYAISSELRDLFGKSVINFCVSLAIGMGILCIMNFISYNDMNGCAIRGFLAYFFVMAAFFWTNSISIQVLSDTRRPSTVDYGWKEFRWYVLYSWGLPTILTTIMAIVNYHPGDHQRPGIGLNHCWFINISQQWLYMNSVITILLVINFGIFVYVAATLWRFALKSTHMKTLRFKLSMTIRLIILTGLPWIFEMIISVAGGTSLIWIILDIIISLQGLFVFLVLVVRKRVVKVLHQRGLLACCSGLVERWLAVGDDQTHVVQPTDVFLQEDYQSVVHTHE